MIQFIQLHHKYNKNFQTKCEKSQESSKINNDLLIALNFSINSEIFCTFGGYFLFYLI